MNQLGDIFQTLGIDAANGLYYAKSANRNIDLHLSSRVKRCLKQINPDAFFCFDDKPLILFFENRTDSDLHKKIWNLNEVPIIIAVNNGNVEIFNGFNLLANENTLEKLGGDDKLTDFSYFQLVTGKTWDIYEKELSYENRIDFKLLDNIGAAREQIIKQFSSVKDKSDERKRQYVKITNALLGKVIFVRYLIDRKVKIYFEGESKERTNGELCTILQQPDRAKQFFNTLADKEVGFNGDLFCLEDTEYKEIPQEAYSVLIKLLKSQEIATGQQSLFDLYDFSIIPVEFISNVYEYFIGSRNQAKQGAYYTPLFLVDYILSETVEKFISDNQTYNCKILDPACGSGVFLVETLRKMIEKYKENAPDDSEQFKNGIKNIVQNNIYGIDKDESAVQVSVFSIYITLLDYMNPPEIADFKFPKLHDTNFFCSDFFDGKAKFNAVFDWIKFDYIVGNPPWFRGKNEKEKPAYIKYIEDRKKNEKIFRTANLIGNKEIAQAFLLRSSDFCAENTKCALIVTSKTLYNLQSKDFRQYFLQNYLIERVFELAPVRREVFDKSNDKAIAPACILFFSHANEKNTDTNLIEHITLKPSRFFSMFKIFSIYRHDIKTVQQNRLKKYDWLWKLLVYGSYQDFNFIKRLKEHYPAIQKIISQDENIISGQGISVGYKDGDKHDVSYLSGKPYLDTHTDIKQFWINPNNDKQWEIEQVHRPRNRELYKAPVLLITKGVRKDLKSVSAVNYKDAVYRNSLTGIKSNNITLLRELSGIFNSSLSSYYSLLTFSSSGIEREQSHDEEKFSIPFSTISDLSEIVEDIEKLSIQMYNNTAVENPNIIQQTINEKYIELDNSVYNAFSITEEEKCLIDYANNVLIPVQMQHENYMKLLSPLKLNDPALNDYANLFIKRFAPNFEKIEKKFTVEILYTQQIVGMFFKVISAQEYRDDIIWINRQADVSGLFRTIIQLGATKITDQLFIQKDIRGFEKEYFYVFKPNEKRLWHRAVGYLDINGFAEAILKAGRDNK
ncbi:MAG: SAM-dependent methyltransferase [Prevotellaceae bacterium]|jgi:hypothetical protein|nr:SAM-dependent methyltransferase [Prevotellaceae bacterium]